MYKFGDKVKFSKEWLYNANRKMKKYWISEQKAIEMIVVNHANNTVTVVVNGKKSLYHYHESFITRDRKHESLITRIANLKLSTPHGNYIGSELAEKILTFIQQGRK